MSVLQDFTSFNLTEQIREAVLLLENKWSAKNISFSFSMDELQICANSSLLKQVWTNLLDNAIKFSPENSEITIIAMKEPDFTTVIIQDQGIGMDEKTIPLIFEKFYQGDLSHTSEGNGLGLPLVKKIIELHHGCIDVKSHPGFGSVFTVHLP